MSQRRNPLCGKCGLPVSMKPKRSENVTRRPDGGWDHIVCNFGSPESKAARIELRAEHRKAVRKAAWNGAIQ